MYLAKVSKQQQVVLFQLQLRRAFAAASKEYDVAVIGGGPGGYVAAIKAGQRGLKTACIEGRGALGGTCLNVGCIPSKALLNASHKYEDAVKHFKDYGVIVSDVKVDWKAMMGQKDKAVAGLTQGVAGLLRKNKVDYLQGWGAFESANTLSVTGKDGKKELISFKNAIIATGSVPTPLPDSVLKIDEERVITSTGALALTEIPKKMVVIGGGVIGLELGSVYNRVGTEVIVVQGSDRLCPSLDAEITRAYQKILAKQGMKFMMETKLIQGKRIGNSVEVELEDAKGRQKIVADYVLVAIGRRPNTNGLQLEKAGLATNQRGQVETVSHLETKVKGIYAIGDCTTGPMLAHKAEEEGIAAVENILGLAGHVNYNVVPGVVYTHPEIANVGRTEEELIAAKVEYSKGTFPFMANSRAKTNGDYDGFVKVLTEKKTDKILGVHILGPSAGELICEAALGMEYGASAEDIARTCHAHPTLSEAMKEAFMAAYDKPIHM